MELFLAKVFKAPAVTVTFDEDNNLPSRSAGIPDTIKTYIGVEAGEHVRILNENVTVLDSDTPVLSGDMVGKLGHGPHSVRRSVRSIVARHLKAGIWTTVGMAIVLLTLTGAARTISLVLCLIAFSIDLAQVRLRR